MADRYEELAAQVARDWYADKGALAQLIASALREEGRDRQILEARVQMLNEAHWELNGALRSASIIAQREGNDTNWPAFRESIRYSLEMSHLIINTIPAPPQSGRESASPDAGGGDG